MGQTSQAQASGISPAALEAAKTAGIAYAAKRTAETAQAYRSDNARTGHGHYCLTCGQQVAPGAEYVTVFVGMSALAFCSGCAEEMAR